MEQELKSEITKQTILDEAFTLFYEHGFKTTSIDKIMNASKLSKGAFYHHYKNKQEIGLEVINVNVHKRLYDAMILPLKAEGNALEVLEHTFLNRIQSFSTSDKKQGCPLNNFINEIGDYEAVYQQALKSIIEKWKVALVTLVERGKSENSIRKDISSEAIAIYLISSYEGIRGIRKLYTTDCILDEYCSALSRYFEELKA